MSLGYPIIMGTHQAVLGGLDPVRTLPSARSLLRCGLVYLLGTLLAIAGIIVCSAAAARRDRERSSSASTLPTSLLAGLLIAVSAGILSSLPNLGISMSAKLTNAGGHASAFLQPEPATPSGSSSSGMGCMQTAPIASGRCTATRSSPLFFRHATPRNAALIFSMAAMWIASFYVYGIGTSLSSAPPAPSSPGPSSSALPSLIGNFWGLRAGEWTSSTPAARHTLRAGMAILLLSVIVIALVNLG